MIQMVMWVGPSYFSLPRIWSAKTGLVWPSPQKKNQTNFFNLSCTTFAHDPMGIL